MALRNSQPAPFVPRGISDAQDATNAFPGAMSILTNLIPDRKTKGVWLPRPAALSRIDFAAFTTPGRPSALLVVGTKVYGMIPSGAFLNKDQPFVYDMVTDTFETITGTALANLPTTQATTGDWTPPVMSVVGTRIMVTHPGFSGTGNFIGWLDMSGFTSNTITGNTHTNTLIDTLSTNPINAGVRPGMTISGTNIQAGTVIVSVTTTSLTLSLATTGTTAGVTLTITGGTTASPQWGAGNTSGTALVSIPVSVAQFNGRAYYAVGAGVQYSDSLNPTQITAATQAITFSNGIPVTAIKGLPLNSISLGGVIQSLICFQGASLMQQITGDQATTDLAANALNVETGTLAPNAITPTTLGLAFVSPEGLRVITFSATVSDPIGDFGDGVVAPFLNAIYPSRMCAAFNQNVLRITVQNGDAMDLPFEEYWFDLSLKTWNGPHSFPASLISAYSASALGFLTVPVAVDAKIFSSTTISTVTATYQENGTDLSWVYQTSLMPDNQQMAMNSVVEMTMMLALPSGQNITILCLDEEGNILDTVLLSGVTGPSSVFGTAVFGSAIFGGGAAYFEQFQIPWSQPLVFKQMMIRITGNSVRTFAIGNTYTRYEVLGYLLQRQPVIGA